MLTVKQENENLGVAGLLLDQVSGFLDQLGRGKGKCPAEE
jgi:hypothetical protein